MASVSIRPNRLNVVDDFIRQVKAALKRNGMEIKELAEESGVSREYIHRLLAGRQNPSLEVAGKIARPLGLSVQTVAAK